jgi:fructokinase
LPIADFQLPIVFLLGNQSEIGNETRIAFPGETCQTQPMAAPRRIGIDLGGTKIEGAILDAEQRIVVRQRLATESERGYEHIVARTARLAKDLLAEAPDCRRIGVGTPGAVSARTGRMKNCNTVCLNDRDLPTDLAREIGCEIVVENDANCFTLAEAILGAGRGAPVVFGVIMGTGVGGGIVVDGRLLRGPQHIAGEWGHHSIDPNGPECYCGQRGCVERYLSGPAVEASYARLTGAPAAMPEIVERARRGERVAVGALRDLIDRFGGALANVINILDPDVVVLGGGLSNIEELYTEGRDSVARYVFNDELRTAVVRPALGDSAGVLGAALLA